MDSNINKDDFNSEENIDGENFNTDFDTSLDDNFNMPSKDKENISIPSPPQLPELPHFPTMADIENFLGEQIPKLPEDFNIEVPPEIEEVIPPEPIGDPPKPPVVPRDKNP